MGQILHKYLLLPEFNFWGNIWIKTQHHFLYGAAHVFSAFVLISTCIEKYLEPQTTLNEKETIFSTVIEPEESGLKKENIFLISSDIKGPATQILNFFYLVHRDSLIIVCCVEVPNFCKAFGILGAFDIRANHSMPHYILINHPCNFAMTRKTI
ncbi:hypothetical protein ACJX0J_037401 [Zea mays]